MKRTDRGMVTAELAVAILAAAAVMIMISSGLWLLGLQLRINDTAAEVARQASRGDEKAMARAKSEAPPDADIKVSEQRGVVVVTVSVAAEMWGQRRIAVPLRATAEVIKEPE